VKHWFISTLFLILSTQLLAEQPEEYNVEKILKIEINSSINPATLNYVNSAFAKAHHESFDAILMMLNTPGGLVSTTKEILTAIGKSEKPVIVWIGPDGASATSAGAIIASGAHLLLMSNGTNIGAATPVELGGDIKEKDLRSKAINDLIALVEGLSHARGRNSNAFKSMVKEANSFSDQQALDKKIIDGMANNYSDLQKILQQKEIHLLGKSLVLKSQNPTIQEFSMDMGQKFLDVLASPQLTYIFMILGFALLYFELQAPGGFIAGSIGAIFLVLAGIGFQVLPLNWGAASLILLAFILFLLEIWITSYGLLAIAGLASLISGSLFLFRTDQAYLDIGIGVIISISTAIAAFLIFLGYFLFRDHKNKQKVHYDLIDQTGVVIEVLPDKWHGQFQYNLKIHGEIWKAVSPNSFSAGQEVTVKGHKKDDLLLEI